jgi:hypothetical protein
VICFKVCAALVIAFWPRYIPTIHNPEWEAIASVDELKLTPGQTTNAAIKASDVMVGID